MVTRSGITPVYVAAYRGDLLAEQVEVESGRRVDRPGLLRALEQAKPERATPLTAELDRLARDVTFIFRPPESGVEVVCCDMPQANELTLHILAAAAERERSMGGCPPHPPGHVSPWKGGASDEWGKLRFRRGNEVTASFAGTATVAGHP